VEVVVTTGATRCTTPEPAWGLRMMEALVTTGAIKRAKLQSNCHRQQTNTQLFIGPMPNQQCHTKITRTALNFLLCQMLASSARSKLMLEEPNAVCLFLVFFFGNIVLLLLVISFKFVLGVVVLVMTI